MEKLGRILLLILHIFIDTFLVLVILLLLLWGLFGLRPDHLVQQALVGIQYSWDSLWGIEQQNDSSQLSHKFQKRAHRQIYVSEPNKRGENIVTQPYK